MGYKTDQEMKCGGGDRSEHWVVTLTYPTVPVFSLGMF